MPTVLSNSSASAVSAVAVVKSDSTVLDFRALYVGGAGDVVVTTRNGEVATFTAVPAGSVLPIQGNRVRAATTATNILALN